MVQGVVREIKPYGAFIMLEEGGVTGLLHISQISHERIVGVDQILQIGDKVKVRGGVLFRVHCATYSAIIWPLLRKEMR